MNIGEKIRNLRSSSELTQEELAERAGLTKGFISQIENDLTSITLDNLESLLTALNMTPGEFFNEAARKPVVYSREKRTELIKEGIKSFELLVPGATNREMEPALVVLKPRQSTEETKAYPGEEFGYILKGRIALYLGQQIYKMKKGDSFYFSADRQHRLQNIGQSEAVVLWVTCPPYF
jgi:transcriptional regulator with XRE-family HTH domain